MKNLKSIFIMLVFVLIFTGCVTPTATPQENKPSDTKAKEVNETKETDVAEVPKVEGETEPEITNVYSWSEKFPEGNVADKQVLYDENDVVITLDKVDYKKDRIHVVYDISNNSSKGVEVTIDRLNADGFDHQGGYNRAIPAGKKAKMATYIYYYSLEKIGIENISNLDAYFFVLDSDTGEIIVDKILSTQTNLEAQKFNDPKESATLLYGDENMEVWGLGLEKRDFENYFEGYASGNFYNVYIVNKTETKLIFEVVDVSVNGYINESYMLKEIYGDSEGYGEISIGLMDLENMGVKPPEDIKTIEFEIIASDVYDYRPAFTSEVITVEF